MTLLDSTTSQPPSTPSAGRTPGTEARRSGLAAALLLAAVALAFADASVVALALPDIYSDFGSSIEAVSWVLTGYALAVAVAGFGGLWLANRGRAATITAAGAAIFAVASATAGFAPSLGALIAARAVQGVGGAALVAGAFVALVPLAGDQRRAARWWAVAGAAGAVAGPALGGLVTQLFDWRAVFVLQAPVALAALAAVVVTGPAPSPGDGAAPRRPRGALTADTALGLTFAAMVGALFLSVILLVVVWGMPPLAGAGVVIALPIGTLAARWLSRLLGPTVASLAGGALLAGGLATLAVLPSVTVVLVAAALALCGLGFGLLSGVLGPMAVPAGGGMRAATLSSGARHLGLVLGLAVVAPVLAADVTSAAEQVPLPATATMLDAPVGGLTKVRIALDIRDVLAEAPEGEVPDLGPVFAANGAATDAEVARLQADLETGMQEVLTRSFRAAFAIGAVFAALAALVAVAAVTPRRTPAPSQGRWLGAGLVATSLVLPLGAAAAGGSDLGAVDLADPCTAPADPYPGSGLDSVAQRIVLSGLNGAACDLGTTREELVLSLEPRSGVDDVEWDRDTIEQALRAGVDRAIEDADQRDSLPGWLSGPLRWLADRVPLSWILDQLGID